MAHVEVLLIVFRRLNVSRESLSEAADGRALQALKFCLNSRLLCWVGSLFSDLRYEVIVDLIRRGGRGLIDKCSFL